ncbi:hypothetical protein [Streptomyces sp. NPDC051014]
MRPARLRGTVYDHAAECVATVVKAMLVDVTAGFLRSGKEA